MESPLQDETKLFEPFGEFALDVFMGDNFPLICGFLSGMDLLENVEMVLDYVLNSSTRVLSLDNIIHGIDLRLWWSYPILLKNRHERLSKLVEQLSGFPNVHHKPAAALEEAT